VTYHRTCCCQGDPGPILCSECQATIPYPCPSSIVLTGANLLVYRQLLNGTCVTAMTATGGTATFTETGPGSASYRCSQTSNWSVFQEFLGPEDDDWEMASDSNNAIIPATIQEVCLSYQPPECQAPCANPAIPGFGQWKVYQCQLLFFRPSDGATSSVASLFRVDPCDGSCNVLGTYTPGDVFGQNETDCGSTATVS
jgi:hypothetical protein